MKKIKNFFIYFLALVGFIFMAVFFAMQFNLLNVAGSISQRNSYFNIKNKQIEENIDSLKIICQINVLSKYAPLTSINIFKTLEQGGDEILINKMIVNANFRFQNNSSFLYDINNCNNPEEQEILLPLSAYNWADTEEWSLMKEVFIRDQEIIRQAAKDANISPRLILGGVMGEQLRFFTNRRESFKSYFEPLKILASLSKFSFGIAGLKPETVSLIEKHLKDSSSVFYLGKDMEHIADYSSGVDLEKERMNRITNTKDPYYSYLYVGLYMKQVISQWQHSGYDISNKPEIIATLYNLGFNRSIPKENALAGGSVINIGGRDYTFGDLAYEFYYSGELVNIFPLVNN